MPAACRPHGRPRTLAAAAGIGSRRPERPATGRLGATNMRMLLPAVYHGAVLVNGTRLAYDVRGAGPPVLLVHGAGEDADVLAEQAGQAGQAGHATSSSTWPAPVAGRSRSSATWSRRPAPPTSRANGCWPGSC
jgi:hypothetical protein